MTTISTTGVDRRGGVEGRAGDAGGAGSGAGRAGSHVGAHAGSHSGAHAGDEHRVCWGRLAPIAVIHLLALGVFWVGFSWAGLAVAAALYVLRMFFITGFYHRYFSHRTFKTGRVRQAVFGLLGTTAAQRGPIWWAAHHREHHRHSDQPADLHSPVQRALEHSHMLWFVSRGGLRTNWKAVPDLAKFPELVWIDRFHMVGVLGLVAALYGLGWAMGRWWPGLGVDGAHMVVWGFGVSTVALYHGTFTINSLAHLWGSRRFATGDDSRNNLWLAIVTLGEGWHNNHHHYPGAARQGFYWWEIDPTYYALWAMEKVGVVSELRRVPARVLEGK